MIFVTVGAQLPFDRLIRAVDIWAMEQKVPEVFAQTGKNKYQPNYIEYTSFLSPADFVNRFRTAEYIIGHAGMGTIITAMEYAKPLLVIPRDASLGEHRNNHQMDTVRRFSASEFFEVAYTAEELTEKMSIMLQESGGKAYKGDPCSTSSTLIEAIRRFIMQN